MTEKFVSITENEYKGSTAKDLLDECLPCDCQIPSLDPSNCFDKLALVKACGSRECINRALAVECDLETCPCGTSCQNQRFQRRTYAKVEARESASKGFGLFALEDIKPGTFIIEYIGEVLDANAFQRRQSLLEKENQVHFYFMTLRSNQIIDASFKGNLSRFINHSCSPNCVTEKWIVKRRMAVGIFACKLIPQGTELTFDYKFERFGSKAQKCMCGERNCQGYIGKKKITHSRTTHQSDEDSSREYEEEECTFSKSTFTRLLKKASSIKDIEDISKISKTLLRSESDSQSVFVQLKSLSLTENQSFLRRFLHFHGLSILKTVFVQFQSNSLIVGLLIDVLERLPICTKNSIVDCKIDAVLKESKKIVDAKVEERIDCLIDKWNLLEFVYRIPKISNGQTTQNIGNQDALNEFQIYQLNVNSSKKATRNVESNEMNDRFKHDKLNERNFHFSDEKRYANYDRYENGMNFKYTGDLDKDKRDFLYQSNNYLHDKNDNGSFNNLSSTQSINPSSVSTPSSAFLSEGICPDDLHNFMARTQILIQQKQQSLAKSQSAPTTPTFTPDKQFKDKYRELISVVVVRTLSRYKDILPADSFKRMARKITHTILDKEIKNSTATEISNNELSERSVKMIKKYCEQQVEKYNSRNQ